MSNQDEVGKSNSYICKNIFSIFYKRHVHEGNKCRLIQFKKSGGWVGCSNCVWWNKIKEIKSSISGRTYLKKSNIREIDKK